MGLSHSHVQRIKEAIVEQLENVPDIPNVPIGIKLQGVNFCVYGREVGEV